MNFPSSVSFSNIWSHSIFTITFIFVGIITTNILAWHWNSQWIMILSQSWFWIDWISLKWNEEIRKMEWSMIESNNNDVNHDFEYEYLLLNRYFYEMIKFNNINCLIEMLTTLTHRRSIRVRHSIENWSYILVISPRTHHKWSWYFWEKIKWTNCRILLIHFIWIFRPVIRSPMSNISSLQINFLTAKHFLN
jgi:hypothetical protein